MISDFEYDFGKIACTWRIVPALKENYQIKLTEPDSVIKNNNRRIVWCRIFHHHHYRFLSWWFLVNVSESHLCGLLMMYSWIRCSDVSSRIIRSQ